MEGWQMNHRFFLRRWLFGIHFTFGMIDIAFGSSQVFVKIEGPVLLDGQLHFTVFEKGSNEIGQFKRTLTFTATANKGGIVTSTIRDYKAEATFPDGAFWRTSNTPAGGFIFIYLDKSKRPFVNIELLEYTDGLPTPMSINGVHLAQFKPLPAK
jgi:hypothetical protein